MVIQSFAVAYGASVLEFHYDERADRYYAARVEEDEHGTRTCDVAYQCLAKYDGPDTVPNLDAFAQVTGALPEIVHGWLKAGAR
jgi:hypothetical protein